MRSIALAAAVWLTAPAGVSAQAVPYCGPADVAFVVDDTFDTGTVLDSLKTRLADIINLIRSSTDPGTGAGPDYRLALVTFKDNITVRLVFGDNNAMGEANAQQFADVVASLAAAGGGGGSGNASDEALNTVINTLSAGTRPQSNDFTTPFRGDVNGLITRKIIVLVTGSLPGGFDNDFRIEDQANAHQRAVEAFNAGIAIMAVFSPQSEAQQNAAAVMLDYATSTGGKYYRTDEPAIPPADAILDALNCAPVNKPPRALCAPATATPDPITCKGEASIDNLSYDPEDELLGLRVHLTQSPAPPYPLGSTLVALTITDSGGATATCEDTVTIVATAACPGEDTTPPSVTLARPSPVTGIVTLTATAADNIAVDRVEFFADTTSLAVDSTAPYTATWDTSALPRGAVVTLRAQATDTAGLMAESVITVTVDHPDTVAPVVTITAPTTSIEATSAAGALVTFSATALDDRDGTLAAACDHAAGVPFPLGPTVLTCFATDAHNNTGTASVTITIVDTTAPTVAVPADVTVDAASPDGIAHTFVASASDLVDGAITPICMPPSGSTFPLGATTVTCTATDAHSNSASASFVVTVRLVDTTAPVVTVPGPLTAEATGPAGAVVTFTTTALDNLDGTLAATCSPASGATFAIGETLVTCTATDAHHNTGSATFTVTVRDTTPPTVTVPADVTLDATSPAGVAHSFVATATDVVSGAITPTCTPASGSTFPLGATTVTCTATDAHSNSASASFVVSVRLVDTTAPVVTVPGPLTAEATGPAGAVVTFTATALDNLDGAITPTCAPASGATFAIGDTLVTCTATDAHHNTGSATFSITVRDTAPPVLTLPDNVTVMASSPAGAVVTFTATAADLVGGALPVACTPASGAVFPIAVTTVACSAVDAAGNTAAGSFTVTVIDPPLNAPVGLTVTNVTPSTATLEWTPGDTRTLSYRVYQFEAKGSGRTKDTWVRVADNVQGLSYLIDKLKQPNKVHAFAVTAVDAAGRESALSTPVEVQLQRKVALLHTRSRLSILAEHTRRQRED